LRASLAFLGALQELVSEREAELVRRLKGLRRAVDALGEPLETGLGRLAEARARVGTVRERLEALRAQAKAVSVRLEEVERGAALAERASAGEALEKEAAKLRLRADQYALDETQALHLWRATEDRGR
jgi:chromosome segregation ATPase